MRIVRIRPNGEICRPYRTKNDRFVMADPALGQQNLISPKSIEIRGHGAVVLEENAND